MCVFFKRLAEASMSHLRKSKGQGFKVDLKCNMLASAILLKNTHNANHTDRGTKKFKVLGSKKLEGPWVSL